MKSDQADSPDTSDRPAPEISPPVSHWDLFTGFLQIGLFGFGGLVAIARHVIIEKRRWLSEQDYAALLGISQALPGGNVINVATILGDRHQGATGAIVAVCGLFVMPLVLLVLLAAVYEQISGYPDVKAGAAGAAAAASGLVLGAAWKAIRALKLSWLALAFSFTAFVCVALFRLPLIPCLLVLVPLCVAATFWERRA